MNLTNTSRRRYGHEAETLRFTCNIERMRNNPDKLPVLTAIVDQAARKLAHVSDLHSAAASRTTRGRRASGQRAGRGPRRPRRRHRGRHSQADDAASWSVRKGVRAAARRRPLTVIPGNHDRLGDDMGDTIMPGPRVQGDRPTCTWCASTRRVRTTGSGSRATGSSTPRTRRDRRGAGARARGHLVVCCCTTTCCRCPRTAPSSACRRSWAALHLRAGARTRAAGAYPGAVRAGPARSPARAVRRLPIAGDAAAACLQRGQLDGAGRARIFAHGAGAGREPVVARGGERPGQGVVRRPGAPNVTDKRSTVGATVPRVTAKPPARSGGHGAAGGGHRDGARPPARGRQLARALRLPLLHVDRAPLADAEERRRWAGARATTRRCRAHRSCRWRRAAERLLAAITHIPPLHPRRDLSRPSLTSALPRGADRARPGRGVWPPRWPARRAAADDLLRAGAGRRAAGHTGEVHCLVTDADIARVWVPAPAGSRIRYFAPTERARSRLRAYGVAPRRE